MVPKTTRKTNDTPVSGRLYLALERNLKARNLEGLKREIEQAKERFGLSKVSSLTLHEAAKTVLETPARDWGVSKSKLIHEPLPGQLAM